jgi:hypothetical protein
MVVTVDSARKVTKNFPIIPYPAQQCCIAHHPRELQKQGGGQQPFGESGVIFILR